MSKKIIVPLSFSLVLVGLLAIRTFDLWSLGDKIDIYTVSVLLVAVVAPFLPYDKISMIKTPYLEITLKKPEVVAAIDKLQTNTIHNDELRRRLKKCENDIPLVSGARILWIDNKPQTTYSARKLLRALGARIIFAVSSEKATESLSDDGDFDLIITDVQRQGDSFSFNNGEPIHEGVNYICKIRSEESLPSIPVIFFAAYDWKRLVKFTEPARITMPTPKITNSVNELVISAITSIAEIRSNPIVYDLEKEPSLYTRD